MQDRWYIIVNPAAGSGRVKKRWPQIKKTLDARLDEFSVIFTGKAGEAAQLADEAIREGFRHLIAVGGDGTHHEVINGICSQDHIASSAITYALLPVGTGNDWIRTYGIPRRLDLWLDMLLRGKCRMQDVGLIHYRTEDGQNASRYFANVAGLAYDAFVVQYSARHKRWMVNQILYLFLILRCLFKYRLTPAAVRFDDKQFEDRFYTINVGICRYSGGGLSLVPHARPDDGLLAVTIAGPVSKLGVILNTYRFYNGSIGEHPKIELYQTKSLLVNNRGEQPTLLEADGEFLGHCPAEFQIVEKALKIVIP